MILHRQQADGLHIAAQGPHLVRVQNPRRAGRERLPEGVPLHVAMRMQQIAE